MNQLDGRYFLRIFIFTAISLGACTNTQPPIDNMPNRGAIHVIVLDSQSEPVADALVTTSPPTEQRHTDAMGSAFIINLEPGLHLVTASHPAYGTASRSVEVFANESISLHLMLNGGPGDSPDGGPGDSPDGGPGDSPDGGPGDSPDGGPGEDPNVPAITILQPAEPAVFTQGEAILFAAMIVDDDTPASGLDVEWRSNLDGVLDTQPIGSQSRAEFTTSSLSLGAHQVTLTVTDGQHTSSATVAVTVNSPDVDVTLYPLTKDINAIELAWSQSAATQDFYSYRIYRATVADGPFEVIDVITDIQMTTYRDEGASSGTSYWYQVGVTMTDMSETRSNIQTLAAGIYIDMGTQVETMIVDSERGYLYALDKVNNSLHFVNLASHELESSIFVGSSPADMDVDVARDMLFVANLGSTEIAVVDLGTRQKLDSLFVDPSLGTWDGNPYRIACTANDTFVFTSYDQWNNLKLIDAMTGANLTTTGSLYQPGLVSNPDGTRLYVGESGSSGSKLHRYEVGSSSLTHVDQSAGVGYGSRVVVMSGDGSTIFYARRKFLANNLASILGTFSETIHATNFDGSLAIGSQNIWNAQTFSILRPLPFSTTVMALDAGHDLLYLYDSTSSRIYLYSLADL